MNRRRIAALVLATAGLVAACGSDTKDSGTSAWEADAGERSAANESLQAALNEPEQRMGDAYEFCIEQITDQLKAPATAQFSERAPDREARDGDRYLFTGTVDSENGFGALLRSEFGCEIQWTPSGGYVALQADIE